MRFRGQRVYHLPDSLLDLPVVDLRPRLEQRNVLGQSGIFNLIKQQENHSPVAVFKKTHVIGWLGRLEELVELL